MPADAPAQDVDHALASVVRISGTRYDTPVRGSGFVVAVGQGTATVVTASHVIEGARFEAAFASSVAERFPVDGTDILGIEGGDPNGLAVFLVRGAIPADVAALTFDVESRPQAPENLLLVGFPQRSRTPLTMRRGYSGRRGNLLILDLPAGEGFSGGPVLRGDMVVGVVTEEDPRFTYAINALVAREFVAGSGVALDVRTPLSEPQAAPPVPDEDPPAARTSGVAVAVVGPRGRADSSATIDLVARLLESGYAATALDVGGVELEALQRGKLRKLRLPENVGYVLLAELGETTLADNPELLHMKTARLDLAVKIFTGDGRLFAAFEARQTGPGFSVDSATSQARRRAFGELVRRVRERLP